MIKTREETQEILVELGFLVPGFYDNAFLDNLRKVAHTEYPVLITGETGSGKELVAEALYKLSNRARNRFEVINCPGLPETLIESELFGHKKGSFTDARTDKAGLFKVADKGTILLDEIGDMPPAVQAKFLRVLNRKGRFRPIGGTKEIKSNARIICATNKYEDLRNPEIFRSDLYHRISMLDIRIPPLAESIAQLKGLPSRVRFSHLNIFFTQVLHARGHLTRITPGAIKKLSAYYWPGNFRELERVLTRAYVRNIFDSNLEEIDESMIHFDKTVNQDISNVQLIDIFDYANRERARIVESKISEVKQSHQPIKSVLLSEGMNEKKYQTFLKRVRHITGKQIKDIA